MTVFAFGVLHTGKRLRLARAVRVPTLDHREVEPVLSAVLGTGQPLDRLLDVLSRDAAVQGGPPTPDLSVNVYLLPPFVGFGTFVAMSGMDGRSGGTSDVVVPDEAGGATDSC